MNQRIPCSKCQGSGYFCPFCNQPVEFPDYCFTCDSCKPNTCPQCNGNRFAQLAVFLSYDGTTWTKA